MPNFWINSFMNHPGTHSLIAKEEEDCMTEDWVIAKEEMNDQDDEQQDFDMGTQKALEEMDALQNEMDILSINGEAEQMKVEMEYKYLFDCSEIFISS